MGKGSKANLNPVKSVFFFSSCLESQTLLNIVQMGPFGSNSAHMKTQFWCQAVLMSNSIHLFSKIFVESILKQIAESMFNIRCIFLDTPRFCRLQTFTTTAITCQMSSAFRLRLEKHREKVVIESHFLTKHFVFRKTTPTSF